MSFQPPRKKTESFENCVFLRGRDVSRLLMAPHQQGLSSVRPARQGDFRGSPCQSPSVAAAGAAGGGWPRALQGCPGTAAPGTALPGGSTRAPRGGPSSLTGPRSHRRGCGAGVLSSPIPCPLYKARDADEEIVVAVLLR